MKKKYLLCLIFTLLQISTLQGQGRETIALSNTRNFLDRPQSNLYQSKLDIPLSLLNESPAFKKDRLAVTGKQAVELASLAVAELDFASEKIDWTLTGLQLEEYDSTKETKFYWGLVFVESASIGRGELGYLQKSVKVAVTMNKKVILPVTRKYKVNTQLWEAQEEKVSGNAGMKPD